MKRREFSLSAATLAATAALGISAFPALAQAQAKAFQSGTDYLTLDKPAATEAPAGQGRSGRILLVQLPALQRL